MFLRTRRRLGKTDASGAPAADARSVEFAQASAPSPLLCAQPEFPVFGDSHRERGEESARRQGGGGIRDEELTHVRLRRASGFERRDELREQRVEAAKLTAMRLADVVPASVV
jgi:hypothetical protein